MTSSTRIAELEAEIARLNAPQQVDLVRINGEACKIVECTALREGRWVSVYPGLKRWVPAIPVIVVEERK